MCVPKGQDHIVNTGSSIIKFTFLVAIVIITFIGCGETPKTIPSNPDGDVVTDVLTDTGNSNTITPKISGVMPTTVSLPPNDTLSDTMNRPFFDEFSWQTFIALCWPAEQGNRGVPLNPNDPNTFLNMSNNTPLVWTSYKNQYDLFGADNPTPWNSSTAQSSPVSGANTNHVFLSSINAKSIIHGEADESFSVPLIDQNKNYALFEIRYNEVQYDFIYEDSLFMSYNLYQYRQAHGDTIAMPASTSSKEGSIMVKAAWRQLLDSEDDSRYYFINQIVYDPVSGSNVKLKLGLVGLHIAQKVGLFPEWVWSSFEQVDNVPPVPSSQAPTAQKPYSFNNGTGTPNTGSSGFFNKPDSTGINQDKNSRVRVQVSRLNEIPTTPAGQSTVDLNARYQAAMGNNWLQYYQLVITQWPTNPGQFKQNSQGGTYPEFSGQPFPVNGCVNTTMETYFQSQSDAAGTGGNSCMSCHYTANNMDYSWSLLLRSH